MTPDVPQIESPSEKEAYAFFGLAAYFAQVLERSALNFALILQLPEVNLVTREVYETGYEALERKTFGQLLRACQKEFDISDETKKILDEALKLRNELIHEFFFEKAEDLVSEKGRLEMMEELRQTIDKFQIADNLIESIYLPIFNKYGITEEYLAIEFNAMTQRAKNRDNAL